MLQPSLEKYLRNKACSLIGYQRWSEYNEDCIALVSLFIIVSDLRKQKADFDICDIMLSQEVGWTRYFRQRLKSRRQRFRQSANAQIMWIIEKWQPKRTALKSPSRIMEDKKIAAALKERVAAEIIAGYKEWLKIYNGTW